MQIIITLIADGNNTKLDEPFIHTIAHVCDTIGIRLRHLVWLKSEIAFDLIVDHCSLSDFEILTAIKKKIHGMRVDVIIQPLGDNRRKRLLAIDMESTLIENEILDDLAQESGLSHQISEITAQAMNGEIDFAQAFHKRIQLLAGTPVSIFDTVWQKVRFSPGAQTLIQTMRAHGAKTLLLSGGLQWFIKRVAALLNVDSYHGNDLEIIDQHITGRPIKPIIDNETKKRLLIESAHHHGVTQTDIVAVGDGVNDLPMLHYASLGIGYRAKERVVREIHNHIRYG